MARKSDQEAIANAVIFQYSKKQRKIFRKLKTRELKESDLERLLSLYEHLHESDDIAEAKVLENIWDEIQENKYLKYFGVFINNLLVSTCTIAIIPNLTRSCRPYGLIENVVTHSRHRQKGYGKLVLKTALDFAWENNCYKVMLMTGRLNEASFKFYEATGFERNEKQAFIAKPPVRDSVPELTRQ